MRTAAVTGERKLVTALFADVVGSTSLVESMDPEDWVGIMNGAFGVMSEAVQRYEGTISQLSGDALVAFFGAPVAHEDDPERAVRAGLEMVEAVELFARELRTTVGIDFAIRVGIATGHVIAGTIGSDLRSEYTALGDAVNVAARMQAAALPGTVLMAEDTYRLVGGQIEVAERGPLAVKGKAEPIRAYEVRAVVSGTGRMRGISGLVSPMVGRADPLARLEELYAATATGWGRAAIVLGEPGIGKSRLLRELRDRVTQDGTWLEAHCLSYGRQLPYHVVVDLVRSLTGLAASEGDAVFSAALASRSSELLGERAPAATTYLAHLLGLPLETETVARLEALDPAALQAHYREALSELLAAAAERSPLAVIIEDVHWADPASTELLSLLLPVVHESAVLIVCTSRPDRDTPGWRVVTAARDLFGEALAEIALEPLSEADSRELVGNLLEIESLPERLRELILQRTEGNPFFLEEVIRMLIDGGVIVRRGEQWMAVDMPEDVEIPDTVNGLLLARMDRLSDGPRRTLRIASVVGRVFPVDVLEAVGDEDGPAVRAALGTLERHGLVQLAVTTPTVEYAFRHALVQEAAYETLLKHERRRLHGAVAAELERLRPERRDELAGVLAYHSELAGDLGRATEHLLRAGEWALARFAYREAFSFYERAAGHLERSSEDGTSRRRRVLAGLGMVEAGRTFVPRDEAVEVVSRVIPDAEALDDPELIAHAHLANADARHLRGEWYATSPPLRDSLDRALEVAESLGDDSLRALPLALLGRAKFLASELREAAALLEEAVPLLERQERHADASMSAGLLAVDYARLGDLAAADLWAARSIELAERSGDPNAILDADLSRSEVEAARGNLREAVEFTRRAIAEAERVGNTLCSLVGHFQLGDRQLRLGNPEEAIPALERSGELAEFCDAGTFAALSEAWLATARAQLHGEVDWDEYEHALATAREGGDRLGEAAVHHQRAAVRASLPEPDWEAVFADYTASIAILADIGARPFLAQTLRNYGMALEAASRPEEAAVILRRAGAILEEMEPVERAGPSRSSRPTR